MTRVPPLAALRAFEAVARLGGVVQAAHELKLTHGAISHQIKALETALGLPLMEHQGRRLVPNENGRVYALQVRHALGDLSRATTQLLARDRNEALVIGTLPSFGTHWLVARLPRLMEAEPGLHLSLRAGLTLSDLDAEGIDAAIRMGGGGWQGLQHRRLFEDRLVAVAAPDFNRGDLPRSPQEVMQAPLLISIENWRPWQEAAGLEPQQPVGLSFNDSNMLLEAVRQGLGVALVRYSLVGDAIAAGRLVRLTEVSAPYPLPYWLVWPLRSEGRPAFEIFRRWLLQEVDRYLDQGASAMPGA